MKYLGMGLKGAESRISQRWLSPLELFPGLGCEDHPSAEILSVGHDRRRALDGARHVKASIPISLKANYDSIYYICVC